MSAQIERVELASFADAEPGDKVVSDQRLDLVKDVAVELSIRLGNATISVGELFDMRENNVIKLDKLTNEPVDIFLKNQQIGTGELVVVDDHFGIKVLSVRDI